MQEFTPFGSNILVEKIVSEEKLSSGIYSPTSERQTEGYIVGSTSELLPVGSKIHFTKITANLSEKVIVVSLEDIVAIEN